ncbi:MAG: HDOD domain-containing protein [Nitrospirae bacterium]|nr:MAG: HDOD domain-containing protein [Nitrospirota bacterium]
MTTEKKLSLKRLKDLPTLPNIFKELLEVLQDEKSSFNDLAKVIKHDQSLTEKILRVANSPYFGIAGNVTSIEQAIMLLGYDLVKGLCLGTSVFKLLGKQSRKSVMNLWRHSNEVAIIGSKIASLVEDVEPSEVFVAGLLHDIGRVVLLTVDRDKYLEIIDADDLIVQELDYFGIHHPSIGSDFLKRAFLPERLVYAVRYHHTPSRAEKFKEIVSVISFAEALSRNFFPKFEDDGYWTEEHSAILLELSIDDQSLNSIREQSIEDVNRMASLFSDL